MEFDPNMKGKLRKGIIPLREYTSQTVSRAIFTSAFKIKRNPTWSDSMAAFAEWYEPMPKSGFLSAEDEEKAIMVVGLELKDGSYRFLPAGNFWSWGLNQFKNKLIKSGIPTTVEIEIKNGLLQLATIVFLSFIVLWVLFATTT